MPSLSCPLPRALPSRTLVLWPVGWMYLEVAAIFYGFVQYPRHHRCVESFSFSISFHSTPLRSLGRSFLLYVMSFRARGLHLGLSCGYVFVAPACPLAFSVGGCDGKGPSVGSLAGHHNTALAIQPRNPMVTAHSI
ncbi:hypothetical protein F5B20DRAFT_175835 [Whalleya microplaca]|nr:hypothetical protein F5B20DRAFT_175835 [Whalleya microplaca]